MNGDPEDELQETDVRETPSTVPPPELDLEWSPLVRTAAGHGDEEEGWAAARRLVQMLTVEAEGGASTSAESNATASTATTTTATTTYTSPLYHAQLDDWHDDEYNNEYETPERPTHTVAYSRQTPPIAPARDRWRQGASRPGGAPIGFRFDSTRFDPTRLERLASRVEANRFDIHAPGTRSLFLDLKTKMKDLDAVYNKYEGLSGTEDAAFVPTTLHLKMHEQLTEALTFFKTAIAESFAKFAEQEESCRKESLLLEDSTKMLSTFEAPEFDQQEFHECASNVAAALSKLTSTMQHRTSDALRLRNFHWIQYAGLRDMVKHVQNIQSELICQLCYQRETEIAFDCGHMSCAACAEKVSSCPSCRKFIGKKIKLFL
tara:strand:+ start:799 stop:1926 length:1128 start_codon:yes stop_codon:yes gene_type:complete